MDDPHSVDSQVDEKPLTSDQLRELRCLAGLSRSALEKAVGLSAGRVRAIENGYIRLRRWESAEIKLLLLSEMDARAREIEKYLRSAEPVIVSEDSDSSPP